MTHPTPKQIVDQMMAGDAFSRWLGIVVEEIGLGQCVLSLVVRPEMLNGLHIAHGGISYSLSDSCLAFSANSHGRKAMSIETSISHTHSVNVGDKLIASSQEVSRSGRIGVYHITVVNQNDQVVALFKGTVFFSKELW